MVVVVVVMVMVMMVVMMMVVVFLMVNLKYWIVISFEWFNEKSPNNQLIFLISEIKFLVRSKGRSIIMMI
jgi:hypothetical protein